MVISKTKPFRDKTRTHQLRGLPKSLHDNVGANSFLDVVPDLFQQLSGKQNHTCRSVPHLSVLGTRDVDQSPGSGMYDVEEFENSGTIVGDLGFAAVVDNKLVHTSWTKSAGEGL